MTETYELFCYSFLFLYSHDLFVKAFGVFKLARNKHLICYDLQYEAKKGKL